MGLHIRMGRLISGTQHCMTACREQTSPLLILCFQALGQHKTLAECPSTGAQLLYFPGCEMRAAQASCIVPSSALDAGSICDFGAFGRVGAQAQTQPSLIRL